MSNTNGGSLNIGVGSMSREAGRGNTRASMHNNLKGKNWSGGTPYMQQPVDRDGFIFISRTDMCLSRDNIKGHRQFESLLSTNKLSAGQAIRGILDPRSSRDGGGCPLIDPKYGFNTLLDNTIMSCTGWPNHVNTVTPTTPNELGAGSLLIEGKYKNGKSFPLSIEHLNTEGDMVSQMYAILGRYPTLLRHGQVEMYFDNIILNRADWKSRIYRFVLNVIGTRVEQFTMTGEAFPLNDSTGQAMNKDTSSTISDGYDTISSEWQCQGFFHNDPIVIEEFNITQIMHNPLMADGIREKTYYRVGSDEGVPSLQVSNMYQYLGYPRIDPYTLEFEIWVPELIRNIIGAFETADEFKKTMVFNNDASLSRNLTDEENDTIRAVIGKSYSELPEV